MEMDNLVLINKIRGISQFYIPNDLKCCDENENNFHEYENPNLKPMVRREVYESFNKLHDDALKMGFNIIIDSGFRTYSYQQEIRNSIYFENFDQIKKENKNLSLSELKRMAEILTNQYVAAPGHSEHQTGLAADLAIYSDGKCISISEDTKEYEWLINNAHKYGFILRYPLGKEEITGYNFEPWHYRYVGLPYSEEIKNDNLTLEEYHEMSLRRK